MELDPAMVQRISCAWEIFEYCAETQDVKDESRNEDGLYRMQYHGAGREVQRK